MLVKVEAINIYSFIYDAQDLSAVRGGSLMLLEMPEKFEEWLKTFGKVRKLTSGASKAIFQITGATTHSSLEIKGEAHKWLATEFPHATIGVAVTDTGPKWDFVEMDQVLTANIREAQMRSFSFAGLPAPTGDEVCAWDHVRPSARRVRAKGEKEVPISAATFDRYQHGKTAKQRFLHRHAGLEKGDWQYTWDLSELAGSKSAGLLDAKIAVFYADGNGFGKLVQDLLRGKKSAEQQLPVIETFDKSLQGRRKEFLKNLLERTEQEHWRTADGRRRVELLLWGGDEAMLVVPAWCGWETAELFAKTMRGATFQEGRNPKELKHAMGLVFAHEKAPIHELARLAKTLAEVEAKADPLRDRLSYLVLESFDHVGEDLGRFRERRCPNNDVRTALVLSAQEGSLERMRQALAKLKQAEFPRRKVFQAVFALSRPGKNWMDIKSDIEPFTNLPEWSEPLKEWQALTGGEQASWFHLAELWDYIPGAS